ncbi:hypothetical protein MTP99_010547 [Tenebrio molitor]|nr:hypothetical protein MTP99_010547 [Tenebrio molitor]
MQFSGYTFPWKARPSLLPPSLIITERMSAAPNPQTKLSQKLRDRPNLGFLPTRTAICGNYVVQTGLQGQMGSPAQASQSRDIAKHNDTTVVLSVVNISQRGQLLSRRILRGKSTY